MNASRFLLISLLMLTGVWAKPTWAQAGSTPAESAPAAGVTTPGSNSHADLSSDWAKKDVKVPNVVGLWRDEAILELYKAGLRIGDVREETSSSVSDHHVISESPAAGTEAKGGSKVDLAIARVPDVKVPDVVGLTLTAAKAALDKVDLKVGRIEEKPSATVAAGLIISQHPRAGTTVREDRRVRLVMSKGTSHDTVPNVVGATQAAATAEIAAAGLIVGTLTSQSSPTVAVGLVISESPAAGSTVNSGSAVNLVISTGAAKVTVPNVVGLTQAAATTAITGVGLVVGSVTTQSSSTVAAGLVISESPVASTTVTSNSTVVLIVSSGLPQVKVPNVVGLTQAAATTAITSVGLVVGTVTTQFSSTVAAGLVINESPIAGTSIVTGSAVSLVIASATPTLTSISVAPGAVSLLLNSPLHLGATGTYSDGSFKDVTGSVTWSSSAPTIATVSSAGLINGISAGGAKITATLGASQGSASVTIGSSSTGFTLIQDVTDTRLFLYKGTDGSLATFMGTRDSTGLPLAINSVVVAFPDSSSEVIQLDSNQRPAQITLSSGGRFTLNWISASAAIVTATSPDNTAQVTFPIQAPSTSTSAAASKPLSVVKTMAAKTAVQATTASPTNQFASVQVQTCGQPENEATVTFAKIGALGGQALPGTANGPGSYALNFPSGPGTLNLGSLGTASGSAYSKVCDAQSAVTTSISQICIAASAATAVATDGISLAEAAAINQECKTMFGTVAGIPPTVAAACAANSGANALQNVNSFLNYLNSLSLSFDIQAIANVQGVGTGQQTLSGAGPQGPYPITPAIDLGCPSVTSVTVSPPSLTLTEGGTAPVSAEIDTAKGIVQSSGYTANWTPGSGAEATVVPNATAVSAIGLPLGAESATVTAGNIPTPPGLPVDITATVPGNPGISSSVSGTAQVTVTAPVSLQITQTLPTVAVGSTITLNVTATSGGTSIPTPPNLVWSSDADSVATVMNAVVTGVSAGPALITVTDPVSHATAFVTITVTSVCNDNAATPKFLGVTATPGGTPIEYTLYLTFCGNPITNAPASWLETEVVDGTTVENNGNVPLSELYPGNLTTNSDGTTTVKYATVGGGDGNSVSYAITETFIWPDGSQQTSSVSFVAPSLTP